MQTSQPFSPKPIYSAEAADSPSIPRVLIAPHRYIQGEGVLDHLGRYLALISAKRAAIYITEGGQRRIGPRILRSLEEAGVEAVVELFEGECSLEEVERAAAALRNPEAPVDCLIAVGGGKCLDAGKCVAYRLSVPAVICPTIASTDAPCSALSVMYSEEGIIRGPEFFPSNPALVVTDTQVIAEAPLRYLVAGMGDALATWYEARTCFQNPKARSAVGARMTLAALAIAELCGKVVFDHGLAAAEAVKNTEVNEAVERVVEANTLLSGIGFESVGVAAAHAVAVQMTKIPKVREGFLHGEMVAMGVLIQLALEGDFAEAEGVADFLAKVGLPVHLGQLGLDLEADKDALKTVIEAAMGASILHHEPFEVTPEKLWAAFSEAHRLGLTVAASVGEAAYRDLHGR